MRERNNEYSDGIDYGLKAKGDKINKYINDRYRNWINAFYSYWTKYGWYYWMNSLSLLFIQIAAALHALYVSIIYILC